MQVYRRIKSTTIFLHVCFFVPQITCRILCLSVGIILFCILVLVARYLGFWNRVIYSITMSIAHAVARNKWNYNAVVEQNICKGLLSSIAYHDMYAWFLLMHHLADWIKLLPCNQVIPYNGWNSIQVTLYLRNHFCCANGDINSSSLKDLKNFQNKHVSKYF